MEEWDWDFEGEEASSAPSREGLQLPQAMENLERAIKELAWKIHYIHPYWRRWTGHLGLALN